MNFGPSRKLERMYASGIHKALIETLPAKRPEESYDAWVNRLSNLGYQIDYAELADRLASSMVFQFNHQNLKSWKEAASKNQRSPLLYRLLRQEMNGPLGTRYNELIRENSKLIRSIPSDVAQHLSAQIALGQQKGLRPEAMAQIMRSEFPRLASWKIKLIARTETAKASTALTEARSEELGLPAYIWDTSQDARVRPSHRKMQGVIVLWSDPPSPEALSHEKSSLGHYHAGSAPNCRCNANPVITADDVIWPHRVYYGGRIQGMSRARFLQISGVPARVAA